MCYIHPQMVSLRSGNSVDMRKEEDTADDEVLTRQCPCLGLSIHGAYVGAWRIRRLQTETWGAHEFTQVRPPRRVKTYILLV
jgi:hypothetical protein